MRAQRKPVGAKRVEVDRHRGGSRRACAALEKSIETRVRQDGKREAMGGDRCGECPNCQEAILDDASAPPCKPPPDFWTCRDCGQSTRGEVIHDCIAKRPDPRTVYRGT